MERKSYEAFEIETEEKCSSTLVPTEGALANTPSGECVCTAESHNADSFSCHTVMDGCTGPASWVVLCTRVPGQRGQVEAEMQPTLYSPSHALGRGAASALGKGGLCLICLSHAPGLLKYTGCKQSMLGGVPRLITGVQHADPLCVWSC